MKNLIKYVEKYGNVLYNIVNSII